MEVNKIIWNNVEAIIQGIFENDDSKKMIMYIVEDGETKVIADITDDETDIDNLKSSIEKKLKNISIRLSFITLDNAYILKNEFDAGIYYITIYFKGIFDNNYICFTLV